jgi:alpha-mannosidase
MTRFDIRMEKIPDKPLPSLRAEAGTIRFQTADLDFEISAATGLIEQGQIAGKDVFGAGAGRLLVIEDDADPWGMKVTAFRRTAGAFALADEALGTELSGVSAGTLPSVRIIEDGPVRSVVEAVFVYQRSSAVLRYFLPKRGREFEIEVRVSWQERDRMLKLSLPTRLSPAAYWGQVAYGREELPADGSEAVAQKWTAVLSRERDLALTIINDGTYGSDYADGEVRISLLRGAAHASDPSGPHNPPVQDRAIPRIDQGERLFRFRLQAGSRKERLEAVEREALGVGERPYVLPYFPPGVGRKAAPAARLSDPVVILTAMKKSEDGKALIIRLFEPTGRARTTVLNLPFAGARTRVSFRPFEIKTLRFNLRTKTFREVDLLERPLRG